LIELLVAVLIMAVGILGVAGLQVISLQQNRSALFRAEAVQLANDLMDRIRVNTDINYSALIDAEPAMTTSCITNSCSQAQMAAFDIAQWKCAIDMYDADGNLLASCASFGYGTGASDLKSALPGGAGSVAQVGGVYVITVRWEDDRDGNTASITLRAQVN
jgi:type IV pilus assembly protein PilV